MGAPDGKINPHLGNGTPVQKPQRELCELRGNSLLDQRVAEAAVTCCLCGRHRAHSNG
ncbi:hypothetical protein NPIL_490261, partial [Nephila pilipes]